MIRIQEWRSVGSGLTPLFDPPGPEIEGELVQRLRPGSLEEYGVPLLKLADDFLDTLAVLLDVNHLAITCTGAFSEPFSPSSTDKNEIDTG